MCVLSVYSVYFVLNFILYTNFTNEFIISFEIMYQILRVYTCVYQNFFFSSVWYDDGY